MERGLCTPHLNVNLFLSVLLLQMSVALVKFLTLSLEVQECCLHVIDQLHVLREGGGSDQKRSEHKPAVASKCSTSAQLQRMLTPSLDRCSGPLLKISAGSVESSGYLMNPEILDGQHNSQVINTDRDSIDSGAWCTRSSHRKVTRCYLC